MLFLLAFLAVWMLALVFIGTIADARTKREPIYKISYVTGKRQRWE